MVEPIVEPTDKLSREDIIALPQKERGKFIESSVLSLILANAKRGLTLAEIERLTKYSNHTLYKHIELLLSKRKIIKVSRGSYRIYYPNGQIYNNEFKDIVYNDKRFGIQLLENVDGKYILVQERELDENGFPDDIGGILIPFSIAPDLIHMLSNAVQLVHTVSTNKAV